jgi:hypothetical protein
MGIVEKLENVKKHYEFRKFANADEEVLLIRGNWVRIMELTRMKNVDKRSPEFKKIKKELEYRSMVMEEWGFSGRIRDDYQEPVEGKVFIK